jgi:probable HAF family extracellular repeat protein
MTSRRTLASLTMLLVALGPASLAVQADTGPYTVQDAGPPRAIGFGVNASGLVVGVSGEWGFRTEFGGGPEWLVGLGGGIDRGLAVHDGGWTVGSSKLTFYAKPVRFTDGAAVDLDPGAFLGEATAVNAAGDIAGYAFVTALRARVWTSGGALELPMDAPSSAAAINDSRVVTGLVVTGAGRSAAFRWTLGVGAQTLPTLGGGSAEGRGINNAGDIVGDSYRSGQAHEIATWWKPGGEVVDLGTLGGAKSSAADVNNKGQIVGYSEIAGGARRAFLYVGGVMTDLNSLLVPGTGWVLLSANAINDAGQIAGEGLVNGETEPRAFLLTPLVEIDTTPPVITAVVTTPDSIWPPKHQMVHVTVHVEASDDSGENPVCRLTGITASESDNGYGDGNTAGDAVILGALEAQVRAERSGPSGSRTYTLAVECVDDSGNASVGSGTVVVGEKAGKTK